MGFLNNTTVTVDAILTKKGRELLAQGTNAFNITKFALADDEIDYRLYDTSHPNGTDYYGAVIEATPLLEAFPDENHVMRYKLVTLPKNTQKMPVISIQPEAVTFTAGGGLNQPKITITPSTANVSDSSYTFILHDQSVVSMVVGQPAGGQGGGGATTPFFLGEDDVPNSKTLVAGTVRLGVLPLASTTTTTGKSTQLTVVGNDTGATTSITVTNKVILTGALM
jgi:hypothetical protein|tara:strand:- start:340 stop:1011 length:672 start_codon:yes stop_codon:yes gene_type:complete